MQKEKYLIMRDRQLMFSPAYWNIIYQTSLNTKRLYNVTLSKEWVYFKSGNQKSIFLKDDWSKKAEYIANKLLEDNKYFKRIENRVNQEKKNLERFLKKVKGTDFLKLSFKKLVSLANKIKKMCLNYDTANVLAWFLAGDKFQEKLRVSLKIPQEDFLTLVTPEEKTALSQLEYELLRYSKLIKQKRGGLEELARELSNNYGWIPFGYDGPQYWYKEHFIKELKKKSKLSIREIEKDINFIKKKDKEDSRKRKEIIRKFKLNKKQLELIKKANTLTQWTDERKKYTFQLYYWYSKILWEIEKKYTTPFKNLKYLFTEELAEIEKDRDYIKKVSAQRIKSDFIVEGDKGKLIIISEKKKNKILKEIEKQPKESEIKGIIACKGAENKYRGKVRIVLYPQDGKKIRKNDFLVATMTSPDYIQAMKKAAGFITDEGGVTCHAAIVAREMNKPCITGTKIATRALKDGDLVEVDAEKGIVRVLKRK